MSADRVLGRLQHVRAAGTNMWTSYCPAHEGDGRKHRASLSIKWADGKWLLNCFAGCSLDDIRNTAGLALGDLFDNEPAGNGRAGGDDDWTPRGPAVATYEYRDERGTLLFGVCRTADKQFPQWWPDSSKARGRSWSLDGVRRVLYRLPEVIAAVARGERIFVCEGEKDVHAVERAGGVATCNPGGAGKGKWRQEYAEPLRGAEVVVVADRDEPGIAHARTVAASLDGVAASVRLVQAADGKDASDHLATGHTLDEFAPLDDDAAELPDDNPHAAPDGYRLTDAGNASRLIDLARGRIRYVHAWGKWIVYRHGRWELDANDALVGEIAKRVARALFALLPKAKTVDKREAMFRWAVRSESAGSIAAMVRLARGIDGVLVDHDQLDANPLILNVRNGTINLVTGTLRAHDPADLCTLQAPVSYSPDARAPLWEACLQRWHPDSAVRDYLQRWSGGAATGRYTETADFNIGDGGNGKSKFFGALQGVLGVGPHGYALAPNKSLLLLQRHEQHETVKADLFRKRLLVASETKAGDGLDEEQVKNLTGGDLIRCRRMREDSWFFWPTHTLALMTNHAPRVRGRDVAIWRRIRVVPWSVTIPEDKRDEGLAAKLHAEAAGILNWIVAGARLWLSEGNPPPEAVRVASDEYRRSQDLVGRFADDVLIIGRSPQDQTSAQAIKAALERWCAEQGESEVPDFQVVTKLLKARSCTNQRLKMLGHRMMRWSPVALVAETEPPPDESE